MPGIFVTGTDTGVGKTVVAGAVAGALRLRGEDVAVMKPFETGGIPTQRGLVAPDARYLAACAGTQDPPELVCPVCLEPPLAPWIAAEQSGVDIDVRRVLAAYRELRARHDWVVVEGAGGIAVPINHDYTMADLARDMGLPVLVVARPSLGTLNHSVLTVSYCREQGLRVLGIVLSNFPEDPGALELTNERVLPALTGVPLVVRFPHDPAVDTAGGLPGDTLALTLESPLLDHLLDPAQ